MNTSLKLKEHHDATEFLGNLLKHYEDETIGTEEVFRLECINIQCCNFSKNTSGYT